MEIGRKQTISSMAEGQPERADAFRDSLPDDEFSPIEPVKPTAPQPQDFSSLQAGFLTATLSSVLVILLAFFTYLEISEWRRAVGQIDNKLDEMLDTGSILLADATARKDKERTLLILAPVLGDRDIQGLAIDLADGNRLAAYGQSLDGLEPGLIRKREITHLIDGEPTRIAWLVVGLSYDRIHQDRSDRLIRHFVLAILILAAIVFSMHQSLRLTVMSPMRRLLASIQSWQAGSAYSSVEWVRNDEFGQLIAAFNQMQLQQQSYQHDLKGALENAEAADQAKTAFLSVISHELRTPLNAIIGLSDILKSPPEKFSSDDRSECLDFIGDGGRRLLCIVNDILDITSAQGNRLEMEYSGFSLRKLVDKLTAETKQNEDTALLSIRNEIPESFPEVNADENRLKRALEHLLANAATATLAPGEICCSAEVNDADFVISVSDSGEGLSVEEYKQMIEPFCTGDPDWLNHTDGIGLGLTYVRTIANGHGGRLELKPRAGGGTIASITLPRSPRPSA